MLALPVLGVSCNIRDPRMEVLAGAGGVAGSAGEATSGARAGGAGAREDGAGGTNGGLGGARDAAGGIADGAAGLSDELGGAPRAENSDSGAAGVPAGSGGRTSEGGTLITPDTAGRGGEEGIAGSLAPSGAGGGSAGHPGSENAGSAGVTEGGAPAGGSLNSGGAAGTSELAECEIDGDCPNPRESCTDDGRCIECQASETDCAEGTFRECTASGEWEETECPTGCTATGCLPLLMPGQPCAVDAECISDMLCVEGQGAKYGFDGATCAPAHCANDVADTGLGEIGVDCGGDCGCSATFRVLPRASDVSILTALDLSGDGQTVVGRMTMFGGDSRAFVWSGATGYRYLELDVSADPKVVNYDGTVIAGEELTTDPVSGGEHWRAVRWVNEGSPQELLPGTNIVAGISDSGNSIVGKIGGPGPSGDGYLWRAGEDLVIVDDIVGFRAISGDGLVVSPSSGGRLWTLAGGFLELPPVGELNPGSPSVLNGDGTAAGGMNYVWRYGLGTEHIGVDGHENCSIRAMSADGERYAGAVLSGSGSVAYYWSPSWRGFVAAALADRGVEIPGDAELEQVTALSADGLTMLGSGRRGADEFAWVAVFTSE